MRTRKILLTSLSTLALLLACQTVEAKKVTPGRAATVAQSFWSNTLKSKSADKLEQVTEGWTFSDIYLFVNKDGGFVMIAGDDQVRAVLGYSLTNTIDVNNMPPSLIQWLQGYQQQIEMARITAAPPYPADAAEWQDLEAGREISAKGTKSVAPLLTTQWDQDYPYNYYCPSNTVTGCAATAQAQMMKYWNFPVFGNGSHTYTHDTYGEQTANFAHTLYEWDKMSNKLNSYSPSANVNAVATLMYHCGVSLEMNYGTAAQGGSAALGLAGMPGYRSIDNSLIDFFFYSPSMWVAFKSFGGYTNESWRDLLISEIDLSHPVLYGGHATQGGHGFVCDGYDSRQYMHFNFGWSGTGDGYYPVDSISPGVGGAGGNVTYTFNENNSALIGAVPVYEMRISDTAFYLNGNGGTDSLLFCINALNNGLMSVTSSESWITLEETEFGEAGWVHFNIQPFNETNSERTGYIVFQQGDETKRAKIVQGSFDPNDMCPLTIYMEATHGNGWGGDARVTIESENGYLFGTAKLQQGTSDSIVVMVPSIPIHSIWHPGGGTDRYINYRIENQYGETVVEVEYAYRNGENSIISSPCGHVGIDNIDDISAVRLSPNPTRGLVNIDADGIIAVEVMDLRGRLLETSSSATVDLSRYVPGVYLVRVTTATTTEVHRIVKR